jgi:hypothetical protein
MAHKLPINNSTSSVLGYLDLTEVRNKNRESTELHMAHKLPINNSTSSVLGYLDLTEVRNKNRDVRIVDL